MTRNIEGKVAIVTGASRGIGLAIARRLAADGARVALLARDKTALDAGVALIGEGHAIAIVCDVTDASQVESAVAQVKVQLGSADILINNAGGLTKGFSPLEDLADTDFLATYDLNVLSAIRFARAVLPDMCEKGWGRIVSISSETGVQPDPIGSDYAAAKAALNAFSKAISRAYGERGVRVNIVSPAFTLTEGVKAMIADFAQQTGTPPDQAEAAMLKSFRPNIAVGRGGQPEEVANAVAFLASDQAAFVNGAVLRVDGGSVASVGG